MKRIDWVGCVLALLRLQTAGLWEIHPIYAIDVCKSTDKSQCGADDTSAWFPFADLQSRLGLASVTPTEKCKAATDNPKSNCPGFTGPAKKHRR